jgi:head-tail adaptor
MADYRINAGSFGHQKVTIESPKFGGQGKLGGMAEEWVPIAKKVPAKVEWLSGEKLLAAKAVHGEANTRITIRFNADVVPQSRFCDSEGNTHNIVALLPDDLKRHWLALCKCVPKGASAKITGGS